MGKSMRPRRLTPKQACVKCGRHDLMTKKGECRTCNAQAFYAEYPAAKK